MRLHQVDVLLGHRRQPRVVAVKHIQLCLGEVLDIDHPVARPVEGGHDLVQLELEGQRVLVLDRWMRKTIRKVTTVVPVLITSCHVSEK
jgi:hypothetical protein